VMSESIEVRSWIADAAVGLVGVVMAVVCEAVGRKECEKAEGWVWVTRRARQIAPPNSVSAPLPSSRHDTQSRILQRTQPCWVFSFPTIRYDTRYLRCDEEIALHDGVGSSGVGV
jgi:hypothetical protein